MELICPVCNGLVTYDIKCEKCGKNMTDKGRIPDYFDDYSPYLEMGITELIDGVPQDKCIHLYSCENCFFDKRIVIDKIKK